MGLSIFYSGRLWHMESLPALIEEVVDVCQNFSWPYEIIFRTSEVPVEGIAFGPPGSEYVWFTFLPDGTLVNPDNYTWARSTGDTFKDYHVIETKTQYGGMEAHMKLMRWLKYVSQIYFIRFRLVDESEYWEKGDEGLCNQWFDRFTYWMDNMARSLEKLDGRYGETGETVKERIETLLRTRSLKEVLDCFSDCDLTGDSSN